MQYLTGPSFMAPDDRDPANVLRTAKVVPGPVAPGQPAADFASVKQIGGGRNQQITVHPAFFNNPAPPIAPGAAFIPSGAQTRTLLILHEVGHLTAREEDHSRDLPRQFIYNRDIVNMCLATGTPGPRIGSLGCGAFYSIGGWRFRCEANWYDGTDPVVLSWSSFYSLDSTPPRAGEKRATALGRCPGGTFDNTVTLKVTDAQGWQDEVTRPTGCP